MTSFANFVSAFMKNHAGKKNNAPKHRSMKLESLEERQLLAVTVEEFAAIRDSYGTEFGFSDLTQDEVNIVEINLADHRDFHDFDTIVKNTAKTAPITRTVDGVEVTTKLNLLLVRTTGECYSLDCSTKTANDVLKITEVNNNFAMIGSGAQPLQIKGVYDADRAKVFNGAYEHWVVDYKDTNEKGQKVNSQFNFSIGYTEFYRTSAPQNNESTGHGGGIQLLNGNLRVKDSFFTETFSCTSGAAIYATNGSTVEVYDTIIDGCYTWTAGGGIALAHNDNSHTYHAPNSGIYDDSPLLSCKIVRTTIQNCLGYEVGGAFYSGITYNVSPKQDPTVEGSIAKIKDGMYYGNYYVAANVEIIDSQIINNGLGGRESGPSDNLRTDEIFGCGIYNGGNMTITNSLVTGNYYWQKPNTTSQKNDFLMKVEGGGVYNGGMGNLAMDYCYVTDNEIIESYTYTSATECKRDGKSELEVRGAGIFNLGNEDNSNFGQVDVRNTLFARNAVKIDYDPSDWSTRLRSVAHVNSFTENGLTFTYVGIDPTTDASLNPKKHVNPIYRVNGADVVLYYDVDSETGERTYYYMNGTTKVTLDTDPRGLGTTFYYYYDYNGVRQTASLDNVLRYDSKINKETYKAAVAVSGYQYKSAYSGMGFYVSDSETDYRIGNAVTGGYAGREYHYVTDTNGVTHVYYIDFVKNQQTSEITTNFVCINDMQDVTKTYNLSVVKTSSGSIIFSYTDGGETYYTNRFASASCNIANQVVGYNGYNDTYTTAHYQIYTNELGEGVFCTKMAEGICFFYVNDTIITPYVTVNGVKHNVEADFSTGSPRYYDSVTHTEVYNFYYDDSKGTHTIVPKCQLDINGSPHLYLDETGQVRTIDMAVSGAAVYATTTGTTRLTQCTLSGNVASITCPVDADGWYSEYTLMPEFCGALTIDNEHEIPNTVFEISNSIIIGNSALLNSRVPDALLPINGGSQNLTVFKLDKAHLTDCFMIHNLCDDDANLWLPEGNTSYSVSNGDGTWKTVYGTTYHHNSDGTCTVIERNVTDPTHLIGYVDPVSGLAVDHYGTNICCVDSPELVNSLFENVGVGDTRLSYRLESNGSIAIDAGLDDLIAAKRLQFGTWTGYECMDAQGNPYTSGEYSTVVQTNEGPKTIWWRPSQTDTAARSVMFKLDSPIYEDLNGDYRVKITSVDMGCFEACAYFEVTTAEDYSDSYWVPMTDIQGHDIYIVMNSAQKLHRVGSDFYDENNVKTNYTLADIGVNIEQEFVYVNPDGLTSLREAVEWCESDRAHTYIMKIIDTGNKTADQYEDEIYNLVFDGRRVYTTITFANWLAKGYIQNGITANGEILLGKQIVINTPLTFDGRIHGNIESIFVLGGNSTVWYNTFFTTENGAEWKNSYRYASLGGDVEAGTNATTGNDAIRTYAKSRSYINEFVDSFEENGVLYTFVRSDNGNPVYSVDGDSNHLVTLYYDTDPNTGDRSYYYTDGGTRVDLREDPRAHNSFTSYAYVYDYFAENGAEGNTYVETTIEERRNGDVITYQSIDGHELPTYSDDITGEVTAGVSSGVITVNDNVEHVSTELPTARPTIESQTSIRVDTDNGDTTMTSILLDDLNNVVGVLYRGNELRVDSPAALDDAYYTIDASAHELVVHSSYNDSYLAYYLDGENIGKLKRSHNTVQNMDHVYNTDGSIQSITVYNPVDGTYAQFSVGVGPNNNHTEHVYFNTASGSTDGLYNANGTKLTSLGGNGNSFQVSSNDSGVSYCSWSASGGNYIGALQCTVKDGTKYKTYIYGEMGDLRALVTSASGFTDIGGNIWQINSVESIVYYNTFSSEDSYTVLTPNGSSWDADYYVKVNGVYTNNTGYTVTTGLCADYRMYSPWELVKSMPVYISDGTGVKYIYNYIIDLNACKWSNDTNNILLAGTYAFVDVRNNINRMYDMDGTTVDLGITGVTYLADGCYKIVLDKTAPTDANKDIYYVNNVGQAKNNLDLGTASHLYFSSQTVKSYTTISGFTLTQASQVRPEGTPDALKMAAIYVEDSSESGVYIMRDNTYYYDGASDVSQRFHSDSTNEGSKIFSKIFRMENPSGSNGASYSVNYAELNRRSKWMTATVPGQAEEYINYGSSSVVQRAEGGSSTTLTNDDGSVAVISSSEQGLTLASFTDASGNPVTGAALDVTGNPATVSYQVIDGNNTYRYEYDYAFDSGVLGTMIARREYVNGALSIQVVVDETAGANGTTTVTCFDANENPIFAAVYDYDTEFTVTRYPAQNQTDVYDFTLDSSSAALNTVRKNLADGTYVIYSVANRTASLYNAEGKEPYGYADGLYIISDTFDGQLPTVSRFIDRNGQVVSRVTYSVSNGVYTGKQVFDYETSEISTYTYDAETAEWTLVSTTPDPNYEVKNRIFYIDGSNNQGEVVVNPRDDSEILIRNLGFYDGSAVTVEGFYLNYGYGYAPSSSYGFWSENSNDAEALLSHGSTFKSGNGGAVFLDNSANSSWTHGITFAFNDAESNDSSAEKNGGFIANFSGALSFNRSNVENCSVMALTSRTGYGGAVFSTTNKTSTFLDTVFDGNYTLGLGGYGGAVANQAGTMLFVSCSFDRNLAVDENATYEADITNEIHTVEQYSWGRLTTILEYAAYYEVHRYSDTNWEIISENADGSYMTQTIEEGSSAFTFTDGNGSTINITSFVENDNDGTATVTLADHRVLIYEYEYNAAQDTKILGTVNELQVWEEYTQNNEVKLRLTDRYVVVGHSDARTVTYRYLKSRDAMDPSTGGVGGAIANWGTVEIRSSTFATNVSANGGAIANGTPGQLLLRSSNVGGSLEDEGNYAVYGGGVMNQGLMLINGTTVFGNNDAKINGGSISVSNTKNSQNLVTSGGKLFFERDSECSIFHSCADDGVDDGGFKCNGGGVYVTRMGEIHYAWDGESLNYPNFTVSFEDHNITYYYCFANDADENPYYCVEIGEDSNYEPVCDYFKYNIEEKQWYHCGGMQVVLEDETGDQFYVESDDPVNGTVAINTIDYDPIGPTPITQPEYGEGDDANYCKTTPENSNIGFDIPIVFSAAKVDMPDAELGYGVQCSFQVTLPYIGLDYTNPQSGEIIETWANLWVLSIYDEQGNCVSEDLDVTVNGEPVHVAQGAVITAEAGETVDFVLTCGVLGEYTVQLDVYWDNECFPNVYQYLDDNGVEHYYTRVNGQYLYLGTDYYAGADHKRVKVMEGYKLGDLNITRKGAEMSVLPHDGVTGAVLEQVFDEIIPLEGDVNGDGIVDVRDFTLMANAWFSMEGDENWDPNCDLDGDGFVGPGDFALFNMNWNK